MSQGTKIFGMQIPLNPKILVGGLFAFAAAVGFYNFAGSNDETPGSASHAVAVRPSPAPTTAASNLPSTVVSRRTEISNRNKQGVLKLRPVDPASVVDPTLKLALLDRVRAVKMVEVAATCSKAGPKWWPPRQICRRFRKWQPWCLSLFRKSAPCRRPRHHRLRLSTSRCAITAL